MIKALGVLTCAIALGATASIAPALSQNDSTSSTTTVTVHMRGQAFDPQTVKVSIGQTVVFVNDDSVAHNVTASEMGTSGDIGPGKSWKYTFTKEGDYHYSCTYHQGMTGEVVVTGSK